MSITVYYLDDEEDLCSIFNDFFSSNKVKVTGFTDYQLALEAATHCPPDLFFIDYRLPGVNGDDVANQLSEQIPKILVTGDIKVDVSANFLQVISKPYDFNLIQDIIDRYCD
jgi:DNA-binding NtrC family response regulator